MKSYLLFLIGLLFCFCNISYVVAQLKISELLACNQWGIVDSYNERPDWIEIYNNSPKSINLQNYYLSDKPEKPQKWNFPNYELPAYNYVLILASGKDVHRPSEIHTNFKINADGETVTLSNKINIIDSLATKHVNCDQSIGYLIEKGNELLVFNQPTPGQPNIEYLIDAPLQFSHQQGFYTSKFELSLSNPLNYEIRYTINTGEIPTINSQLYTKPITIKNRIGDPNIFSEIPNTTSDFWKAPNGEVYKINIIRAATFSNEEQVGEVFTKSYIVDPQGSKKYTFPVISLITEPDNLFSADKGIYVVGDKYVAPYYQPNFMQDWERPVYVEFFELDGTNTIAQNAEIEIAGQTTRWRRQKSLKLKANGKNNLNRFNYPFFKTLPSYRTLQLRSPFTDYRNSLIKEPFVNELAEDLGLANADCRPVIVFLNGEYWGIHTLEEKQDKYYFQDHYGVDKDSINLLQGNATREQEIIEGAGEAYLKIRNYAEENNLADQKFFDYVAQHINIENYINYYCFQMLIAIRDWPWNNMKYWRPMDHSRKWEWIPYDFDSAYNYPESDMFGLASEATNESVEWSVVLYNSLMENEDFKWQFIHRLEELLNNQFCTDSITTILQKYRKQYEPELEEQLARWSYGENYDWDEELRTYFWFPKAIAPIFQTIVKEDFDYDLEICESTINPIYVTTDMFTCDSSYFWIDTLITKNGLYKKKYLASIGIDSIVQLNVRFLQPNLNILVTDTGMLARQIPAKYQWLRCDNNFEVIPNATKQFFTPNKIGNYAVLIDNMGCIDTTACFFYDKMLVDVSGFNLNKPIRIFPNPASNYLIIENNFTGKAHLTIKDISGKHVLKSNLNIAAIQQKDISKLPPGIYFIAIENENSSNTYRLIKL